MAQNTKHSGSRKILLAVAIALLAIIVVCSLTACSIFTDAVKSLFGGDQGDPAAETGGTADSTSDSSSSGEDSGSGEYDPGIVSEDPVMEVTSTYVQVTSPLTYDKASHDDMTITATHSGKSFYQLIGMGLINDGESARVRVKSETAGANSTVQIDGHYLSSLPAGNYYFYYCVYDNSAKYYYDPFRLTITNSAAAPTDIKIDYDIECPSAYVTFRCDCGGAHTISCGSNNYDAVAGATRVRIGSVEKSQAQTATVTCVSTNRNNSVTKASPDASAYSNGYLNAKYSFMGHTADGYIEDDSEAADLLQYLAYEGAETSLKVYVSSTIHSEISANAQAAKDYLAKIQSMISVPWSLHFGCSYSNANKEVTFQIQDTSAGATISSDYSDSRTYQSDAISSHHPELNERMRGSELPIDNKKKVSVRNVKELLAIVEAGYCPTTTDEGTLTIYNKARNFCYTYLTNDMTDLEKLHVIYDYLAGEVDYDYSALNLYSLIGEISTMSLANARATIDAAIADDENRFSDAMKDAITAIKNSAGTLAALVGELRNNYLQRLGAFSIEGVFDDKAAVCEGISYAFMLLARIEGIECYQVSGYATQSDWVAHAWNKVHLDGAWYSVDATWGNIYINDVKYVTHRYFMVDDATMYKDHKEMIGEVGVGITNLSLGDAEYYKSVETTEGRSLYVANFAELKSAVAYYLNHDSNYVEVMVDPVYKATSTSFMEAYHAVTGHNCIGGITSSTTGSVFIVYFR